MSIPITLGAGDVVVGEALAGCGLEATVGADGGGGETAGDWMGVTVAAVGAGVVFALALVCARAFVATERIKQTDDKKAMKDKQVSFSKYGLARMSYPLPLMDGGR